VTTTYSVADRTVSMPVVVRDAVAASATFAVDADAARALVPHRQLDVVKVSPRHALLAITLVRYRDNDLGTYNEISIAPVVTERGTGPVAALAGMATGSAGIYIHRLPVDEEFSCAAGRGIWGFPKTVERLTIGRPGHHLVGRWDADGRTVLRLAFRHRGSGAMPATEQTAYSTIDGVLHRTQFVMHASGVGARSAGAKAWLGDGAAANELRGLGLPSRPLFAVSMGRLQARFDAPEPVT
jgi:hypothetical protein